MPFIQRSPLEYQINSTQSQRRWDDTRAPTVADYKQFRIGDLWRNSSSNDWWILCFRDSTQGIWRKMAGTAAAIEFLLPDAGTSPVVATAANEVTVAGGTGITSTGGLNTVTWALDADVLMQVTAEDASTCAPALYNLNMVGTATNGINTTAAGSTLTVAMASPYADGDFVFQNNTAATPRTLWVENNDADPASYAALGISSEPLAGDAYVYWEIDGTDTFAMGIDNSDTDRFKFTNSADPSSAADIFMVDTVVDTFWFYQRHKYQLQDLAGGDVITRVQNSDDTNLTSHAFFNVLSGGTSGGDPFIHFQIPTALQYSLGIDNSDTDNFKLTDGASPSLGTEYMILDIPASRWEFPINVFEQEIANIGGGVQRIVSNTDNTNAASDAFYHALTGGASGGDPHIHFEVDGVTEYSLGIDNTDADDFKLTTGASPSAGTELIIVETGGDVIIPANLRIGSDPPGFPSNGINVDKTVNGAAVAIEIRNTSAVAASTTILSINSTTGTNNDNFIGWNMYNAVPALLQGYSFGIRDADSDSLYLTTGTNLAAALALKVTPAGEITMPLQPAFLAYNSADDVNQTGNGAVVTVDFDTALFDQNADFAADTFTAPVTGRYRFSASVMMTALGGSTSSILTLVTTGVSYILGKANPTACAAGGEFVLNGSIIVPMTATNTAYITLQNTGAGADNNTIMGSASPHETWFSGELVC